MTLKVDVRTDRTAAVHTAKAFAAPLPPEKDAVERSSTASSRTGGENEPAKAESAETAWNAGITLRLRLGPVVMLASMLNSSAGLAIATSCRRTL